MLNLNIADLNIAVYGADCDSFKKSVAKYISDDNSVADATVTFKLCENINVDGLTPFRVSMGRNQYSDGNYQGYFDYIDELGKAVTHARTDMERKNITFELTDTSEYSVKATEDAYFNFLAGLFRSIVISNDGIIIHASTIVHQGEAITFTAASGTGKSTHTGLWMKHYPEDTVIINDDSPVIRFKDGRAFAYGAPWSGKTDINENIGAPLKAMVFIERATECSITKINSMEAFVRTLTELPKPVFKNQSDQMMEVLNKLFATVPCYLLKCDISKTAVDTVRDEIFK